MPNLITTRCGYSCNSSYGFKLLNESVNTNQNQFICFGSNSILLTLKDDSQNKTILDDVGSCFEQQRTPERVENLS